MVTSAGPLYATDVTSDPLYPSTLNPNHARQFASKDECQAWIDANPRPAYVAREHGFES